MIHSSFGRSVLLGGCLISLITSGCITVSAPAGFANQSKKTKVSQASYEEVLPPTPKNPENPEELKLAYARWMEELNQVVEARKHYTAVATTEPDNVEAILGLARLDQVTGQYAEAEQKYKKAVRMAPESANSQYGLGQFYASQLRWQEALDHLSASMLADPENTAFRYQLAVALVHTGDVDSALPHFIRTVGDAEGHYNVALILNEEGDLDGAEKHFLLAVTKKPKFEQAQQWLTELRDQRENRTTSGETLAKHQQAQIVPEALQIQEPERTRVGRTEQASVVKPLNTRQREQLQNQQSLNER